MSQDSPPPPPSQPPPDPPGPPHRDQPAPGPGRPDSRTWAMGAHLSAFVGAWAALAFVGPLVVWLVKRDEDPYVAYHAKEALNFNLTFLIVLVVSFILVFLLVGFVLLPIVAVVWIIFTVIAAVRANAGEYYRYPMTIRFID